MGFGSSSATTSKQRTVTKTTDTNVQGNAGPVATGKGTINYLDGNAIASAFNFGKQALDTIATSSGQAISAAAGRPIPAASPGMSKTMVAGLVVAGIVVAIWIRKGKA